MMNCSALILWGFFYAQEQLNHFLGLKSKDKPDNKTI